MGVMLYKGQSKMLTADKLRNYLDLACGRKSFS